jgi:hypothetical protein
MGAWFALKSDRSKLNPCFGLRGESGTVFQSHSKNNPCKAMGARKLGAQQARFTEAYVEITGKSQPFPGRSLRG